MEARKKWTSNKYQKGKGRFRHSTMFRGEPFSNIEFEKISCEVYNHFIKAIAAEQEEGDQ